MLKFDVFNRFSGKVQFTAEIDCDEDAERGWKLRLAILWAIKTKTNLRCSNLRGSDLSYSNLRGSDLRGSNGYITGPYRSDGYRFDARIVGDKWAVVAGCRTGRNWSTDDYREHAKDYDDDAKCAETLAILDYLDAMVALKGGAQ